MIKLSILIPSVHTRRNTFLPKIQDEVFRQIELLNPDLQQQVEVLILTDNKRMMLGEKRNRLVELSQGMYYVFIDDDDRIESTYVSDILNATSSGSDMITFKAMVKINDEDPKVCVYSKEFDSDENTEESYHRLPNHICAVRRDIGRQVSFPNIKYGEDSAYSKLLKPLLKSQHTIDRVLYYYDFNSDTTETQEHLKVQRPLVRKEIQPIVDVVILSNGKNPTLRSMTQQTVATCINGANGLAVRIIVIEQVPGFTYRNATTYHLTQKFNYNAFANFGSDKGNAEWIMIANNDLKFSDGWLHNLLTANHPVMSPKCPIDPRQTEIIENTTGPINGKHFSGWCFMIKRELWKSIGGFDTCVSFWFSDDVTIEQVLAAGVEPMLVPSSKVRHLGSTTLKTVRPEVMNSFTWDQVDIFNKKYGKTKFYDHPGYLQYKATVR